MKVPVAFAKMSGAGNDFIVLDGDGARSLGEGLAPWVRAVCRRGISIGADGVLVVEPTGPGRARVVFRNPDGVEAFCGNGTRCAARYARLREWTSDTPVLETAWGAIPAEVRGATVRIHLPPPRDAGEIDIPARTARIHGRRVQAGVPHFVVRVGDLAGHPVADEGPLLRRHAAFGPEGTNVDWLAPAPGGVWGIRTWERGVEGETLACGSGAVAAAYALRLSGAGDDLVLVPRSGIPLRVTFGGEPANPSSTVLEGDARLVLTGEAGPEAAD